DCQEPIQDEEKERAAISLPSVINPLTIVTYWLNYHKCCTLSSSHPRCAVLFSGVVEDDHECSGSSGSNKSINAANFGGDDYKNDNDHCGININIKDLKWDKEVPEAPPNNHPEK
ncbi:hypothetical protein PV325_006557, partial [Microctonus aethiopoides]